MTAPRGSTVTPSRSGAELPTGQTLSWLYYASGHLML